jgi:SWI/SNF-related matrix-associated actin-dependent regulator of chromatin subfamily A member 5
VLLARGEERTNSLNSKITTEMSHSLANFSLESDAQDINLFNFEGEDYKKKKTSNSSSDFSFISLPQRERKKNYDVDEYYREIQKNLDGKDKLTKKKKIYNYPEYQFYDRSRLDAITDLITSLANEKTMNLSIIKDFRFKDSKANKFLNKNNKSDETNNNDIAKSELCIEADRLQNDIDTGKYDLSNEIIEERKMLLNEGFSDWSRRDFFAFCNIVEIYGNSNKEALLNEVSVTINKSIDEISKYSDVFFKKFQELTDWTRIAEKIERGNKKVLRQQEIKNALDSKILRHQNTNQPLLIQYGQQKNKVFTEEEDLFLLKSLCQYGYGNWSRILIDIRSSIQFKFNFVFKSRTEVDLQRRSDILVRLVEKENENFNQLNNSQNSKTSNKHNLQISNDALPPNKKSNIKK